MSTYSSRKEVSVVFGFSELCEAPRELVVILVRWPWAVVVLARSMGSVGVRSMWSVDVCRLDAVFL